jgi:hypothetical protein
MSTSGGQAFWHTDFAREERHYDKTADFRMIIPAMIIPATPLLSLRLFSRNLAFHRGLGDFRGEAHEVVFVPAYLAFVCFKNLQ